MDTEKMREEVYEYLMDNLDVASDIAKKYDFDWLRAYDGIDDLFHGYFGGDLVDIIEAFRESDVSADSYELYYVDENGFNAYIYTAWDIEDIVENHIDDVVDSLMEDIENGNLDYIKDGLTDDLLDIVSPSPTLEYMLQECAKDVEQALSCLKGSLGDDEKMYTASRDYQYATQVLSLFENTRFCGIPEELYGSLDCERLIDHIVCDYTVDGFQGGVTIQKFAEIYIYTSLELGVYK